MFDIKYDSSILEVFCSNNILYYRFIGSNMPKVNPVRKGFRKRIYFDIISTYLDKLDEIMKFKCTYEDIKKIGIALYGQLIPEDLGKLLSDEELALTIVSENNEIPWELLHDGEEFFGAKYSMGRNVVWNDELMFKHQEQNNNKICLIISNPTEDLPESSKETTSLMKFLRTKGIKCRFLAGSSVTIEEILSELSSYKYDFIHYSGHIDKNPHTGEYSFILAQEKYFPINSIKSIDFGNPFVFLNACVSGKIEVLNDDDEIRSKIEGAVIPFISAGSCGVIGSMWKISDEGARRFSEILYSEFMDGKPIGEVLLNIRKLLIKENNPNDNVWPSFIYYGHPGLYLINSEKNINIKKNIPKSKNLFDSNGNMNFDVISDSFTISIKNSLDYVKNGKITTTHLFFGMLLNDNSNFTNILKESTNDFYKIKDFLSNHVGNIDTFIINTLDKKVKIDNISKSTLEILFQAYNNSIKLGKNLDDIETAKVILTCFCSITKILEKFEFDFRKVLNKLRNA